MKCLGIAPDRQRGKENYWTINKQEDRRNGEQNEEKRRKAEEQEK